MNRTILFAVTCLLASAAGSATTSADIFRWDNGAVIPGTEGIEPGPRVVLSVWDLSYADLSQKDLTSASFSGVNLNRANFAQANLTDANFNGARLELANLENAIITGGQFAFYWLPGLSQAQLYSTASYQAKDLRGIKLNGYFDWGVVRAQLAGWDLSAQDLTGADLSYATLTNANLSNAILQRVNFAASDLTGANLTGAVINHAEFGGSLAAVYGSALTKEQIYSTASYQSKNLQGITLSQIDLTGFDFRGQNLTGADLGSATLTRTNMSGANLTSANLHGATILGLDLTGAVVKGADFTSVSPDELLRERIYSTASYRARDLSGIRLAGHDLRNWNFIGQNLAGVDFESAVLADAQFLHAIVTGARFVRTTRVGLAKEQIYSTISYQSRDLQGIDLSQNDLTGWNFRGQNLTAARFDRAILTNADLSRADTRGAFGLNLTGAIATNLILPDGRLNLRLHTGETLVAHAGVPIPIRFHADYVLEPDARLNLTDNAAIVEYSEAPPIVALREQILAGRGSAGLGGDWTGTGISSSTAVAANQSQPDSRSLGFVDNATLPLGPYSTFHGAPVDDTSILIAYTRTGDANLDGLVNDDDVTIVGASYAPGVPQPSWALGDFDYNGFVDDDDVTLLGAFYDPSAAPLSATPAEPAAGASTAVAAVPEPSAAALAILVFVLACGARILNRGKP